MRQKHGQNFLIDKNIVNNIIKAAEITPRDEVLEIGPGKGILTKAMQPLAKHITAVEIDADLYRQLNHYFTFHNTQNITLINEDFLKLPCAGAIAPQNGNICSPLPISGAPLFTLPFKAVSNLPYNVGTALIQKLLPLNNWTQCVFMLQKEVVQRLAAKEGGKDYGYISIFTQYYADCQILFDVSPKCFNPPPKVMSSVIKLTNKRPGVPDPLFFAFVKHSFSMRRKTILNCVASFKNLDKTAANKILITCGLDPLLRPDKLSIDAFLRLTAEIKKCIILQS